jgi:hypothetical protein
MTSIGLFSQGIYNACSIPRLRLVECFRPNDEITMNEIKAKKHYSPSLSWRKDRKCLRQMIQNKIKNKKAKLFLLTNSDETICTSK